jgi:hypothetical protein
MPLSDLRVHDTKVTVVETRCLHRFSRLKQISGKQRVYSPVSLERGNGWVVFFTPTLSREFPLKSCCGQ